MPFLTLNGVTIPVKSNAVQEKFNEHRLDRDRMFDGAMRVIRGGLPGAYGVGVYRQWDVNTASLSDADANVLLGLVNGDSLPLSLSGDITGNIEVAVIPVPGTNNPLQTAGGFRRLNSFTLHETPAALPPDTSAVPFLFLRGGVQMFSDNAGTVGAGDGDPIGQWKDATGNGRYFERYFSDTFKPHRDGDAVHFDESGSATFGAALVASAGTISDWNGLTAAEIMGAVQADVYPPASDAKGAMWWFGPEGGHDTFYAKADGHVYGGFAVGGVGAPYDIGNLGDLSDGYHVFGESSDATAYKAYFDNVLKKTQLTSGDAHTALFDALAPAIGHGNPGANDHSLMRIKHLVIFDGILTPTQRRSWYDYLRGAATDPPLP